MTQSSPDDSEPVTITDVVEALFEMRDSLTRVSLVLQDHRFNFEASKNSLAKEPLDGVLKNLTA